MNHQAGMEGPRQDRPDMRMPQASRLRSVWPSSQQHLLAPNCDAAERDAEQRRRPQADAQRAPDHARIARAERLRGQRRHRRHASPMPSDESCEQHGVRRAPRRATTWSPRRPSSARSVVIIATWPSWVSAIGQASCSVSIEFGAPARRVSAGARPRRSGRFALSSGMAVRRGCGNRKLTPQPAGLTACVTLRQWRKVLEIGRSHSFG